MPWDNDINVDEYYNESTGLLDLDNSIRNEFESRSLSPCSIGATVVADEEFYEPLVKFKQEKQNKVANELKENIFRINNDNEYDLLKNFIAEIDKYSFLSNKTPEIGICREIKDKIDQQIRAELDHFKGEISNQFDTVKNDFDANYAHHENYVGKQTYKHKLNIDNMELTTILNRYYIDVSNGDYSHLVNFPTKGVLHPIEIIAMSKALWSLNNLNTVEQFIYNGSQLQNKQNVVLVDFFARHQNQSDFKEIQNNGKGNPEIHTIALWKCKMENNVNKIAIIDPNNQGFSIFLSENYLSWTINGKSFILRNINKFEPIQKLTHFYSGNNLTTPWQDMGLNFNKLPRDCIDIAVKIAFEIFELQLFYKYINFKSSFYDMAYELDPYSAEINYKLGIGQWNDLLYINDAVQATPIILKAYNYFLKAKQYGYNQNEEKYYAHEAVKSLIKLQALTKVFYNTFSYIYDPNNESDVNTLQKLYTIEQKFSKLKSMASSHTKELPLQEKISSKLVRNLSNNFEIDEKNIKNWGAVSKNHANAHSSNFQKKMEIRRFNKNLYINS